MKVAHNCWNCDLAQLGVSGTAVGIIAGLGELLGYALRVVSGRVAEKTGAFWPITLFGYAIQMVSVPLLALAGSWQVAAPLIVAERIGKATRTPPRDVMLSHAGEVIGFGWAFGLNEALDQPAPGWARAWRRSLPRMASIKPRLPCCSFPRSSP